MRELPARQRGYECRCAISALVVPALPVASRVSEDPARGLAFDLLRPPATGERILTGHKVGAMSED